MCNIKLCMKVITILGGKDISMQLNIMWFTIRKILARIIDGVNEEDVESEVIAKPEQVQSATSTKPVTRRTSTMHQPLMSIPEGEQLCLSNGSSPSSSRVLRRKPSKLSIQCSIPVPNDLSESATVQAANASSVAGQATNASNAAGSVTSSHNTEKSLYARAECEESSIEKEDEPKLPVDRDTGGHTVFESKYVSLPMNPPKQTSPYFMSIKEKPTGIRGIGMYISWFLKCSFFASFSIFYMFISVVISVNWYFFASVNFCEWKPF